jgi:hypothetical protein
MCFNWLTIIKSSNQHNRNLSCLYLPIDEWLSIFDNSVCVRQLHLHDFEGFLQHSDEIQWHRSLLLNRECQFLTTAFGTPDE